jgi:hypothetical protein
MRIVLGALLVLASACGAPNKPVPDAGPDTSCGLDCAAQGKYGLIVDRCFEYSSSNSTPDPLPALGLWVKPVFTLEGGVKVLPVEYRVGGQTKLIDDFGIVNGNLVLMRREFPGSSQSVTYKDAANAIVGVKWMGLDIAAGQTTDNSAQAFVVGSSGQGTTEAVSYPVTTVGATVSEQKTPLKTYPDAIELLFGESPPHGSDAKRVFVPDVGFTVVAAPFSINASAPTPVMLQAIRDLGTADGGTANCSLGG